MPFDSPKRYDWNKQTIESLDNGINGVFGIIQEDRDSGQKRQYIFIGSSGDIKSVLQFIYENNTCVAQQYPYLFEIEHVNGNPEPRRDGLIQEFNPPCSPLTTS